MNINTVHPLKRIPRFFFITYIITYRLASAKFPLDHFDYVFIDEAGQAVEPESVVAIESLLVS